MAATVLLAQGLDQDKQVVDVRGTPFYKASSTGVGDSIQELQQNGLLQVPAYLIGEGRVAAGRAAEAQGDIQLALQEEVWSNWHDTFGEMNTLLDKQGILGTKSQLYVASFQNGGMFIHNPSRIQDTVFKRNGQHLTAKNALQLEQDEVNLVLDAIKGKDVAALQQMGVLHGSSKYAFTSFGEFADASVREDFLRDMPGYVVLRTADEARQQSSGYQSIAVQRGNENLALTFGGLQRSGAVLDVAEKLGYKQFGSHHDGYQEPNSGRVVVVCNHYYGVDGSDAVSGSGRSVGVAPEALQRRAKIVAPLSLEIAVKQEAAAHDLKTISEDHVRRLLTECIGYTGAKTDELLQVLSTYRMEKQ